MRSILHFLLYSTIVCLLIVVDEASAQDLSSSSDKDFSYEISGNKLFVFSGDDTYSFSPYGDEILRIGYHFGQDTTYPASLSVIMEPQGTATVEDTGDGLIYRTSDYEVLIGKEPVRFTVIHDADWLLWQGKAEATAEGSRMEFQVENQNAWYGGGSRAIPMNRAGRDLVMVNEPHYGYGWDQDILNISIPVVVSSQGYALYFENPTPGLLSLPDGGPGLLSYEIGQGPLSCFVICSPDPDSLMEPYTQLTGRQLLPPIWAMGYIQSRFGYENETEAANVVNTMVAQGFPMDAIIFDLQWQGGVGEMGNLAWDLSRFPDPQDMMQGFLDKGVRSVCIADPYFTEECQYFSMLSGLGWFAKEQNGSPYIIDEFWAGPAGLIDVSKPAAANWFWQRCKSLIDGGVTGLWTDLGEPERAPEDMFFEAGTSTEVRQTYNLRWAKAIFEGFSEDYPDRRLFNLTRSGYAGMQRYSTFPWSGDVQKTFDGMYAQVPIMLGMGLSGFGYMGHDVGGFVGELNPELYTRWQQMGAFSPIMRAHGVGVATEPIYFNEPYKGIVKSYIKLRYQLLPYNYTLAYINSTTGMPLARPLFFADNALTDVDDAFLWGNDLLVAPVFEEGSISRNVSLPEGKWLNYYNWESYTGGENLMVNTSDLAIMPLFVRAGAMIPMIPDIQHTAQYDGSNYIIKYYADPGVSKSHAMIYIDDGTTQGGVLNEEYSKIHLNAVNQSGNAVVEIGREGKGYENEPMMKQLVFEVPRTSERPELVYFNHTEVPMTDNWDVYGALDEVVLYNDTFNPKQLYVKVQWSSTSQAILEIRGLELETNYSVSEFHLPEVSVYPNPVSSQSQINITPNRPGKYRVSLYNHLGQQVCSNSMMVSSPGTSSKGFYELFPLKLAPGLYILEISGSGGVSSSVKIMLFD